MRRSPRSVLFAYAAYLALLLSATVSHAGAAPERGSGAALAALAQAAVKEGAVVWYTPYPKGEADALINAFKARYPQIKVEYLRLASGALTQRFATERESGAPTADLYNVTDPVFQADSLKKGWVIALDKAGIPDFPGVYPARYINREGGSAITTITASVISYNSDLVAPKDVPKTWEDVLDPKWRGKIIVPDPRSTASYIGTWTALLTRLPKDYITRLMQQKPRFVEGGAVPATQLLAAGEGAIVIPGLGSATTDMAKAGAPVKFVVPEISAGPQSMLGLNSRARNPNAARLFAHFMLSKEGSLLLAPNNIAVISPYNVEEAAKLLPIQPAYFDARSTANILGMFGFK